MSVKIFDVEPGSPAYRKGIRPGDELISVNGTEIGDVLDYRFFADEYVVSMLFRRNGVTVNKIFNAGGDIDSIGLGFETYLMDGKHSCKNKCAFCFIDQMPPGLRESLYFKDDDSRLSFLFGNYITLTNLSEHDAQRIAKLHISPLNISVHTMNPQLRVQLMKNPNAGSSLDYLGFFAEAGIKLNTQLVLCRGINDGNELKYSLENLDALYPAVQSVAAVPAGLTKFRDGLPHIEPYDQASAAEVIDIVDDFNSSREHERIAFSADEFYLCAKRPIPSSEYYGSYPQLENGVGSIRLFLTEFYGRLSELQTADRALTSRRRSYGLITGVAAAELMNEVSSALEKAIPRTQIKVYTIVNDFFGRTVTVSGLLTAKDILSQLRQSGGLPDYLVLPASCLKSDDEKIFLDDVTLEEFSEALSRPVLLSSGSGAAFVDLFLTEPE